MIHTLILDRFTPPGLNATMRGKIKARIRIADACHQLVAAEAYRQRIPKARSARRVRLHVTYARRSDLIDPDNALKCILDSLTNCGLLVADDYFHVETMPPVYYLGDRPRTVIELEDIPLKALGRINA